MRLTDVQAVWVKSMLSQEEWHPHYEVEADVEVERICGSLPSIYISNYEGAPFAF